MNSTDSGASKSSAPPETSVPRKSSAPPDSSSPPKSSAPPETSAPPKTSAPPETPALPEKSNFIDAIYIDKYAYPLYDNQENPVKYYFEPTESKIWEPPETESGPDRVTPAAAIQKTQFRLGFKPGTAALFDENCGSPARLVGSYDGVDICEADEDSGYTFVLDSFVCEGLSKPLPWAFFGDITWRVTGPKSKKPRYEQNTAVRIYVFPENLPSYFDNVGLSIPLLSNVHFLPEWMTLVGLKGRNLTWPVFVANTMFNHCKFQYETYSGASKYVSYDAAYDGYPELFTANKGVDFWIDLFTTDSVWIHDLHQLNCYDLAAICQAFIALGVDQSVTNLKMVYLKPFGYIKPTKLIGRVESDPKKKALNKDMCNNPFYGQPGYDNDMLCKNDSSKRSQFGNHMFLSMKKGPDTVIIDACAGPHTGTETLAQYITNSIDATPTLYSSTSKAGKEADAKTGMGIQRLVTSRAFEKKADASPSASLLDNLAKTVGETGEWSQHFLSVPYARNRSTATWTFKRNDKKDIYTINVFKYFDATALQKEFKKRAETSRGFKLLPSKADGYSDDANGSMFLFYDAKCMYLATVSAAIGKATVDTVGGPPALQVFKNKLQAGLSTLLSAPKPTKYVSTPHSATDYKSSSNKIETKTNSDIRIVVKSDADTAKDYWRGFRVDVENGNALFVGAVPTNQTTNIQFNFLARRPGDDSVSITMYGSNLDIEKFTLKWTITDP